jgi:hypothetical protein
VGEIVELMARGLWFDSRSLIEFATTHNVSARTVEEWAGEASRQLDALTSKDKPRILAAILRNLDAVRGLALAQQKPIKLRDRDSAGKLHERIEWYSAPNTGDAIGALHLQARLHHLLIEQTEDVTPRKFEGWTLEELKHYSATGEKPARLKDKP